MFVICYISALELLRTPPIVSEYELSPEQARFALGRAAPLAANRVRSNERDIERMLRERLLRDLKNLSLPVHIMVDSSSGRRSNRLVTYHRMPDNLPRGELVSLGGDLWATSAALTLALGLPGHNIAQMALMMYEACGTYAPFSLSSLARLALNELIDNGLVAPDMIDGSKRIREFYDVCGRRTNFTDSEGDELPWQPVFLPRSSSSIDMWRRPPLTTTDDLRALAETLSGRRGTGNALAATRMVHDGSASPLESQVALLLLAPRDMGGEGWCAPLLNRRINLPDDLQTLAGTTYCIADELWDDTKGILEVLGEAYHSDSDGFKIQTGRSAALEALGYQIAELTYNQISDLERFDMVLPSIASKVGQRLGNRSARWLKRRDALHAGLFPSAKA